MIDSKTIDKLRFDFSEANGVQVMRWLGESVLQNPQKVLNPYFDEVVSQLTASKSIIVDFKDLDYMNSGTVQPIIYLLKGLNTLNVPVKVMYSPVKKWQNLSFQALKAVTTILKNIVLEA